MNKTALLVVDVQESFKHRDYWVEEGFAVYAERQNHLIRIARNAGWNVVFVLHNEDGALPTPFRA